MTPETTFSMEELCRLVELAPRTVRFYITQGLVDPPGARGRGAQYGAKQVEQLLTIQKWQQAGLSLEAIRRLLTQPASELDLIPREEPGSLRVWSRLTLAAGLELHIQPELAQLSPQQIRQLSQKLREWLAQPPPPTV